MLLVVEIGFHFVPLAEKGVSQNPDTPKVWFPDSKLRKLPMFDDVRVSSTKLQMFFL
jgi:hypothetical protein